MTTTTTPTTTPGSAKNQGPAALKPLDESQATAVQEDRLSFRPAHPLANRLWSEVRDRSEVDRRFIYGALQSHLNQPQRTANQAIAVTALERFDRARARAKEQAAKAGGAELPRWADGPPSKRRYVRFRSQQPNPRSWPSSQLIVNAFSGRWGKALAAANLAVAPDVLALRRTTRPATFTEADIDALLRTWQAEVDASDGPEAPLRFGDFTLWIMRRGEDPDYADVRLPSRPTVRKIFGRWDRALSRLGVIERHPLICTARRALEEADSSWAARATAALDLGAAPVSAERNIRTDPYSTEEILRSMAWLTHGVGAQAKITLTVTQWDQLRAACLVRAAKELGRLLDVPCGARIMEHPGLDSWAEAKVAAGLASVAEVPKTHRCNAEAFTDEELLQGLVDIAVLVGHLPGAFEYRDARKEELARRQERDPWARIPTDQTLRLRLAGKRQCWKEVLDEALRRSPQLAKLKRESGNGND